MRTYRAILLKDQVQWREDSPSADTPVDVYITVLGPNEASSKASRGEEMAAALEDIAKAGGLQCDTDPVDWQRQVRADRDLPGRE